MKTKIDERKNSIVSLKSNYAAPTKGIKHRIKFLQRMSLLNVVMAVLCVGIVVLSIISEPLGVEFFKWQSMALLTILSLSFILRLPKDIYELKLLNHFNTIANESDFIGIDELNRELKNTIDKLNTGLKSYWMEFGLAIVILIMGIWQMGFTDKNPYWNYMKLPVILFYGIVVIRFLMTNNTLNKNIKETEKYWN